MQTFVSGLDSLLNAFDTFLLSGEVYVHLGITDSSLSYAFSPLSLLPALQAWKTRLVFLCRLCRLDFEMTLCPLPCCFSHQSIATRAGTSTPGHRNHRKNAPAQGERPSSCRGQEGKANIRQEVSTWWSFPRGSALLGWLFDHTAALQAEAPYTRPPRGFLPLEALMFPQFALDSLPRPTSVGYPLPLCGEERHSCWSISSELLGEAMAPLLHFLHMWSFCATLHDPCGEFVQLRADSCTYTGTASSLTEGLLWSGASGFAAVASPLPRASAARFFPSAVREVVRSEDVSGRVTGDWTGLDQYKEGASPGLFSSPRVARKLSGSFSGAREESELAAAVGHAARIRFVLPAFLESIQQEIHKTGLLLYILLLASPDAFAAASLAASNSLSAKGRCTYTPPGERFQALSSTDQERKGGGSRPGDLSVPAFGAPSASVEDFWRSFDSPLSRSKGGHQVMALGGLSVGPPSDPCPMLSSRVQPLDNAEYTVLPQRTPESSLGASETERQSSRNENSANALSVIPAPRCCGDAIAPSQPMANHGTDLTERGLVSRGPCAPPTWASRAHAWSEENTDRGWSRFPVRSRRGTERRDLFDPRAMQSKRFFSFPEARQRDLLIQFSLDHAVLRRVEGTYCAVEAEAMRRVHRYFAKEERAFLLLQRARQEETRQTRELVRHRVRLHQQHQLLQLQRARVCRYLSLAATAALADPDSIQTPEQLLREINRQKKLGQRALLDTQLMDKARVVAEQESQERKRRTTLSSCGSGSHYEAHRSPADLRHRAEYEETKSFLESQLRLQRLELEKLDLQLQEIRELQRQQHLREQSLRDVVNQGARCRYTGGRPSSRSRPGSSKLQEARMHRGIDDAQAAVDTATAALEKAELAAAKMKKGVQEPSRADEQGQRAEGSPRSEAARCGVGGGVRILQPPGGNATVGEILSDVIEGREKTAEEVAQSPSGTPPRQGGPPQARITGQDGRVVPGETGGNEMPLRRKSSSSSAGESPEGPPDTQSHVEALRVASTANGEDSNAALQLPELGATQETQAEISCSHALEKASSLTQAGKLVVKKRRRGILAEDRRRLRPLDLFFSSLPKGSVRGFFSFTP